MKNMKIKNLFWILALSFAFLIANQTYADFTFKQAPKIESMTSTWVSISWENLEWASWYLVSYWTKSSSGGVYENELPDLLKWTWAFIPELKEWTTYYVAVSAFDSEYNEEVSPELTFDYIWTSSVEETQEVKTANNNAEFSIDWVEVLNSKMIKVFFSNDLDVNNTPEFMLSPKNNKNSELAINNVSFEESNQVVLNLQNSMDVSTEYELVAISVTDVNNNTIESWIDWMVTFSSPVEFEWETNIELNAAPIENNNMNDSQEGNNSQNNTNAASQQEEINNTNSGAEMNSAWEEDNLVEWNEVTWGEELDSASLVENAESLPTTWPKEFLVLILALMLGWAVFFFARKKSF